MNRKFPRPLKRIVIKIGSSVIATYKMKPEVARLESLVRQMCAMQKEGVEVLVVSSGAIVLGMGELERKVRPSNTAALQTLSAIGQTILMETYNEFFKQNKTKCAQVLLTWDDFANRARYNNVRSTLKVMSDWGVVPIINENDTISTDEIKFGDNDRLSALLASLVQADLLVILSDVEGLYDVQGDGKKIFEEIKEITKEIEGVAGGSANKNVSKGGMSAKLQAVKIALKSKIPCIIASGETEEVLTRILKGERIGTLFIEQEQKLIARKHWISFGAKPKGTLVIDEGAKKALQGRGASLLLPGIVSCEGHFKKDDVVVILDQAGVEIARGIINYSVSELHKMDDKKGKSEAIHCNDLVLSER